MTAKTPREFMRETVRANPTFNERQMRAVLSKLLLEPGNRHVLHGVIAEWVERNYYPAAYRKGAATAGG